MITNRIIRLFILHPILVLIYGVLDGVVGIFLVFSLITHSALLKMSKTQKELSSALTRI